MEIMYKTVSIILIIHIIILHVISLKVAIFFSINKILFLHSVYLLGSYLFLIASGTTKHLT